LALQTLRVLLCPYGGVIADRVDKRRLMVVLQIAMGVQALVLGVLTVTDRCACGRSARSPCCWGQQRLREPRAAVVHARDGRPREPAQRRQPQLRARQRRARDRPGAGRPVDRDGRRGICFLVNAATFVAVVASLVTLDRAAISTSPRALASRDSCARASLCPPDAQLGVPLLMMALAGAMAYEFQ